LAAEKLTAEDLPVSDETLRNWLLASGLWERKRRRDTHRQRRNRRECFGELTQADGSEHDWLQGRGPRMVLLVMIDDATSQAIARFYPAETTEGYMDLLRRYFRKHGRMVAIYTDHDSVFCGEHPDKKPAKTQFARALEELEIGWIPAGSPQAKGRVERFNGTAQDRLVKELGLAHASTMEQANEVLDKTFLPWFNECCTVRPVSPNDAHRPLHRSMNLASVLSVQDKRKVTNDYTIRLDNQVYQLLKPALPGQRGGWVIVEKRLDGTLHIRFKKTYLAYHRIGPADRTGALPPNPRSLPLGQTPAEMRKKEGHAVGATQPSAVRLTPGRSGRTPAEPCLPKGKQSLPQIQAPRPRPGQAWMRRFRLPGSPTKADIPTLAK
jgi:transposase InsO family protein